MPEISVDKDHNARFAHNEIRPPRKIADVALERHTQGLQHRLHRCFGFGASPLDPRHDGAALFRRHDVAAMKPLSLAAHMPTEVGRGLVVPAMLLTVMARNVKNGRMLGCLFKVGLPFTQA